MVSSVILCTYVRKMTFKMLSKHDINNLWSIATSRVYHENAFTARAANTQWNHILDNNQKIKEQIIKTDNKYC